MQNFVYTSQTLLTERVVKVFTTSPNGWPWTSTLTDFLINILSSILHIEKSKFLCLTHTANENKFRSKNTGIIFQGSWQEVESDQKQNTYRKNNITQTR